MATDVSVNIPAVIFSILGSMTTSSSTKSRNVYALGWVVICFGTFNTFQTEDIEIRRERQIEVTVYSGENAPEGVTSVQASTALRGIEMDALTAVTNPQLASSLPIAEFARALNLTPQRLGQVVLAAKAYGDRVLNRAQIASAFVQVPKADVATSGGSLSKSEFSIVSKYLRLRNIVVL